MTYYPVIIPTLNRFQHFKECVESLAACTHADKTELVIGLDYPPAEKYVEGWKQIKEYIPSINGFAKVTVFEHDHNLGPGDNFEYLINYASKSYNAWIESEDDNVFSPCFLDYMDKCLEMYKDDDSIYAISGYMYPFDFSSTNKEDVNIVVTQNFTAYGIGVWKNKLNDLLKNMPEHYMKYICSHRKILKKMRANMRELYRLVFWTKAHPELDRKCDFTYTCYCIVNNKYIIHPLLSLVRNMGYDSTGENCGRDTWHSFQPISTESIYQLRLPVEKISKTSDLWMQYKNSMDFSKEDEKRIIKYYRLYMLFGFFIAESVIAIISVLKKILKRIYRSMKTLLKTLLRPLYRFLKKIIIAVKNKRVICFPKILEISYQESLSESGLKTLLQNKLFSKLKNVKINYDANFDNSNFISFIKSIVKSYRYLQEINVIFNHLNFDNIILLLKEIKETTTQSNILNHITFSFNSIENIHGDNKKNLIKVFTHLKKSQNTYYDKLDIIYLINNENIYDINEVIVFAEKNNIPIYYDLYFENINKNSNIFNDELAKKMALEFFYGQFKKTGMKKYFSLYLYLKFGKRYDYCPYRNHNQVLFTLDENISFCKQQKLNITASPNLKETKRKCRKERCNDCPINIYGLSLEGEKKLELEVKKERY